MSEHKLAKAANFAETDAIISADDIEEKISEVAIKDKRYIDLLNNMSDIDKAELFMKAIRSTEWMVAESILYEDIIIEALDEMLVEVYQDKGDS
jgi:hypothetical protein